MKILFVSDTYYPHLNGVYYFVCRIGSRLQKKGHQVAVIAPSETVNSSLKKIDGLDVYGVPSLPVVYYPKVRITIPLGLKHRIRMILDTFKPDIIHLQDHFSISRAVIEVNKQRNIPIMGTNHFMTENLTSLIRSEKWRNKWSDLLWKNFSAAYNQLALITTPSETAARLISPKLKVEVMSVSSGIDLKIFNPSGVAENIRQKYHIPEKPVLLFVGRLDPEKNIDEILHAVAFAVKKEDFCFVVVGNGIKKSALEQLSDELGIREQVIFTGYVSDEDLPHVYKLSRCFIISSIAELLSLSALQGMAAGLPLIAVNKGALGELVQDGVNGFLYEGGDIYKLVRSMTEVMASDELFESMSRKSLEFVQKHDIRETVLTFEKIYRHLYTGRVKAKTEFFRLSEDFSQVDFRVGIE
jgi:1,2-diacylglycerol 3-alpha-glucosyltransferase